MSISLSWFKEVFRSEKEKEKEKLQIEEQELKNQILKRELAVMPEPYSGLKMIQKPYLNLKLVNNVLTIILNDGNILSKPNASQEDFNKARIATSEEELFKIASSTDGLEDRRKEQAEAKRVENLIKGLDVLKASDDFIVEGNSVYLKGISRSLPSLLVERFVEIISKLEGLPFEDKYLNEEYQALKRFFLWCCLNPRIEVADKLYGFLVENSFRITKQGFFTALRNVVTVEKDNELVKFVSNSYNKVKAVWKKKPVDYYVWQEDDGEYTFSKQGGDQSDGISKFHGNLQDLYLDLPNMAENRFTDAHTQTFDIRIGQVVSMPMEDCSWSTADCAHAGLHFTSNHINYVGCGDTSVLVLINPIKFVA